MRVLLTGQKRSTQDKIRAAERKSGGIPSDIELADTALQP
jgi:hypothetical protein